MTRALIAATCGVLFLLCMMCWGFVAFGQAIVTVEKRVVALEQKVTALEAIDDVTVTQVGEGRWRIGPAGAQEWSSGPTLPDTCATGQLFIKLSAQGGKMYTCVKTGDRPWAEIEAAK